MRGGAYPPTAQDNQDKNTIMKKSRLIRAIVPILVWAFLVSAAASAQTTSFTATGLVNAVLAPPIITTNALGQVFLHGFVHTARVQGLDPRATGQELIIADGAYNADGTVNLQGTSFLQLGTWDAAGTNFTPTGGTWLSNWRGVQQTNNSLQLSFAGYGSGGTIDGWRLEGAITRGPDLLAPLFDSGTIKAPPVTTTLAQEDFTQGTQGWDLNYHCGDCSMDATSQQLHLRADWSGCRPATMQNYFFARFRSGAWNLADSQTLECQADLIQISENTTNNAMLWLGSERGLYAFDLSRAGVGLHKWTPQTGNDVAFFWWDNTVHITRGNVTLYMTLTRDKDSLIITARLLDKTNSNAVLFQRSFVDTSEVDPTLTTAEFLALTGMTNMDPVVADPGAAILSASGMAGGVGAGQFTDGFQPAVEAVWDNFSLRLHEEPPLRIAPAMELAWPAPAGVNYGVQAAPTVRGPWLRVQVSDQPGIKKLTVPSSSPAQFFRLMREP